MSRPAEFSCIDLLSTREVHEFVAIVRDLTGVSVHFFDPAGQEPPADLDTFNPLCVLIRSCPLGRARCADTDASRLVQVSSDGVGRSYLCHAGLIDFAVPIYVDGRHVATMNCGQMLPGPPTEAGFGAFLNRNGDLPVCPDRLRELYFRSPYLAPEKVERVLALLSLFASYVCEAGSRLMSVSDTAERLEIEQAKNYIRANFREPIGLGDVAAHVALSPAYFSSLFRRVTGMAFVQYLQSIRIEEAKRLLTRTDWSATRIALEVGFGTPSYFAQVFRRLQGCAPGQYRARHSGPGTGRYHYQVESLADPGQCDPSGSR